ncbi:MAG: helix-turn-helix domain-containing protein [Methylococcaceae bacterium]|nr:helix-turn-helix domain-containing protein [Methylococcaceae bacterium]
MDKILSLNNWIPTEAKSNLSKAAKAARLRQALKRDTLSEKTGIPTATIKRFETSGEVSLDNFLKIAFVLGDLEVLKNVFIEPQASSLDEIIAADKKPKRQRGSQ